MLSPRINSFFAGRSGVSTVSFNLALGAIHVACARSPLETLGERNPHRNCRC